MSLVPSLTEAVVASCPEALVGATDWCTHPPDLSVPRVRGTKNPDTERVIGLAPDLVLANEEENREADLAVLRSAGIEVLVTEIRTVPQACDELDRLLGACGLTRPRWLDEAQAAWEDVRPEFDVTAVVPIWRRPWMVLGRDTFAGDLLARLGVRHLYADHHERYPKVPLPKLTARGADLVLLPDEPYEFHAGDGPEAFPGTPAALVSGRHLTWYGPSLRSARERLSAPLRAALS